MNDQTDQKESSCIRWDYTDLIFGSIAAVYSNSICMFLTLWLPGWMIDLEVEGLSVGSLDHSDVASCPLVCLGQCVGPPVRPVNLSSIHGDGKRMRKVLVSPQNLDQPRAIVFGRVDGIRPAYRTFFLANTCSNDNHVKSVWVNVFMLSVGSFLLTWHRSRGCGAPDNPQWVHWAILHYRSPYGSSSCPLHSWMQLQS